MANIGDEDLAFLTSLRRDLHPRPKLGSKEDRTSGIVARLLNSACDFNGAAIGHGERFRTHLIEREFPTE
jgi:metal-dependent amidase/aminoacylase/carboxypeptidase family protein